ncbi:phospholipase D beta 1-like isoform X1 [Spinacia oleracea]|uniref:Phospholipase D n=1 Tax=Spinacia oleracea TaxID=3562 RepID=A0A9R0K1L7_SPIOL|nr:phospholipase D beta 1-like isoform X1 [Spinacia oleracea]
MDDSLSGEGSRHGQGTEFVPFQTCQESLEILLLHGHLDIWVKEAKKLPNMDQIHRTMTGLFGGLSRLKSHGTSDPYVNVSIAGAIIARTFVMEDNENPVWKQHFFVPVAHTASELHFVVKDDDVVGSEIIGVVGIPTKKLLSGKKIQGTFPIMKGRGKPWETGANLSVSIQYIPVEKMNLYHSGVGNGPEFNGVPRTYFPLRKGNKVTLYQDAHYEDGMLPDIKLDYGMDFVHRKCWHDIYNSISNARHLVYLTGWSVVHLVRLVRDDPNVSNVTLGELLKGKAQEGVRVLLLVWDDPTSRKFFHRTTEGMLATDDEVTYKYFKGSSVHVVLCPRSGGKGHSLIGKQEAGAIYTHHQKTIIVDADAGDHKRKLIAFLGGLDLCKGRYDTPDHSLYRTLHTVHEDDYHNPNFTGSTTGCPRQPWHDLHCQIDGPAVYDILANFQERWLKASPRGIKKLKRVYDDYLIHIDKVPTIIGQLDADQSCHNEEDDIESWHVQVFRSLDSNSVKGFPKDPKDGAQWNLFCGKNVLIDMSIHTAYVHAIRSAQHFIYIENQYFLGSSFNWDSHRGLGANNLIPIEIALKIAEKIKADERFAAYVVLPMWPEGDPKSLAMQRILFWQYKTMQMMYQIIYKALVEKGVENTYEPQDFLNFFCLGNREISDEDANGVTNGSVNTPQAFLRKNRRFMIYVHSKGMIVDDEYVIMGSANINQRSMEGTRDTEIAMGAYQPHYTWASRKSRPHGEIYGYRMSLWAEHLGTIDGCFMRPESLECVRRVRILGEYNWIQFALDELTEMKGHLLKYPLKVDRYGKVSSLPGSEKFPDLGGKVKGTFSGIQENLTI